MEKYTYKKLADGDISVYLGKQWLCFMPSIEKAKKVFEDK